MIRLRTSLVLVPLLVLAACGSGGASDTTGTAANGPHCSYPTSSTAAARKVSKPPATPDAGNPTTMVISTNDGDIPVTFEPGSAPCTVNSFISLAKQGYFDNITCTRVTTEGDYILQCGDPSGTGAGGPGYSFADELVKNDSRLQPCQNIGGQSACTYNAGTIAMANAGPNTNGSQFFLVYGNSLFPPAYTVFGHMDAAGLGVVKAIAAKGVGTPVNGPSDGTPKETVTITSVK
ncbi:MAG: peptidylprolyl isomerase [Marmoricola sp.]|nr:peptidylprolyl isomerase [Marmoricola sp.]